MPYTDSEEMAMETNDSTMQAGGELPIVVGVDGSACATHAAEFATKEAARWGAILHHPGRHVGRGSSIGARVEEVR